MSAQKRRAARLIAVAATAIASLGLLPAATAATGTWTSILSPKHAGQVVYTFGDEFASVPATITVAGQASDDVTSVDVYCFSADNSIAVGPLNPNPVAVDSSTHPHSFSASGVQTPNTGAGCVLRAVPSSYGAISSGTNAGYVGAFTGPTYYPGGYLRHSSSPGQFDYDIVSGSQSSGAFQYGTPDVNGVVSLSGIDGRHHRGDSGSPYFLAARLTGSNVVRSGGTATHSGIVIDGVSAYLPNTLLVFAANQTTVPSDAMTNSRSAITGDVTSIETAPLRTCGAAFPPAHGSCDPQNPGVVLKRTVLTSARGTVITVRDAFVSTDHKSHTVRLEYVGQLPQPSYGQVGVQLPGHAIGKVPHVRTITSLPAGPHTIIATTDLDAADGSADRGYGGLTYSGKPTLYFNDDDYFAMRYTRTVREGRPARLGFGFETATTARGLGALARTVQNALRPTLRLTAPRSPSGDNTPTVRGRITNATNGLPAQVTVTLGARKKTVAVGMDGRFAAGFSVGNGTHIVTVRAADPSGYVLRASRRFRVT